MTLPPDPPYAVDVRRVLHVIVTAGLFSGACGGAGDPDDIGFKVTGFEVRDVEIPGELHLEGLTVPAKLFVPILEDGARPMPAVVVLHEFFALHHYLAHHADSLYGLLDAVQTETLDCMDSGRDSPKGRLPPELRHICWRGMQKDPANRYQSAGELIADLRRYIDGTYEVKCMFTFTKRALREGGRFVDRRPNAAVALAATHAAFSLFGVGALIYMLIA